MLLIHFLRLSELGNPAMRKQHWVLLMDGIRKNAEKAKNEQAAMIAVMPANGIISIAFLIGAVSLSTVLCVALLVVFPVYPSAWYVVCRKSHLLFVSAFFRAVL